MSRGEQRGAGLLCLCARCVHSQEEKSLAISILGSVQFIPLLREWRKPTNGPCTHQLPQGYCAFPLSSPKE